MSLLHKLNNFNRPARMSRGRVAFVMIVAVAADALQFWLGPLGWFGAVQVIDVLTMIITTLTIGFHVLLLPTFLIELFPVISALPTWTGCVIAVLALRGKDKPEDALEISTVENSPSKLAVPPLIPPSRARPEPPSAPEA